ncbi:zeta-sarcoglycan-like [Diadema antillarum]|uniref:zeta-sarcoglycan-like n=1 Tax=Diadema antillarum TaxID=105358 RepID=UPI003A8B66F2
MNRGDAGGYTSYSQGSLRHREPDIVYKVGIYGWRKRCIYLLVLILMAVITVNLALTVWILRVLDFSLNGMGKLKIGRDGIRLEGTVEFLKAFYTSQITSIKDKPLVFQSAHNVSINARNGLTNVTGKFVVGGKSLTAHSERFVVYDTEDNLLFYADEEEVRIGTDKLTFSGTEGTVFEGPVETARLRAPSGESLLVEALTSSIEVQARDNLKLRGLSGDLSASCLADLKLRATNGRIRLQARTIRLVNLPQVDASEGSASPSSVYELCVCENGDLFLAPPSTGCTETDVCL